MTQKRILVTGGAGFIGSHLVTSQCLKGNTVWVLDNLSTGKVDNLPKEARLIQGDVSDKVLVRELMREVDACYHLAAVASVQRCFQEWSTTHLSNCLGSIHVFEAAKATAHRSAIPVVYASSAAIYGDKTTTTVDEQQTPQPISAYGVDKLSSELHAKIATMQHGVPTVGLRFFNVYGPKQDPHSPYSGVISIFSERHRTQEGITIYGDGLQSRDFIYVADVVDCLEKAMQHAGSVNSVFNVCTGIETSLLTLTNTLASVSGMDCPISFLPQRSGDIRRSLGCPKLADLQLGFSAQVTLQEGLKRLLAEQLPVARVSAVF